jgi:hypothetical protein
VKNEYLLWYAQSLAWPGVLRLVRRGSRQDPEIDSQV